MRAKNNFFRFKQFQVGDHKSTMRVGTDAVLIGAWVAMEGITRALEVGTGSGVIALILAQRSSSKTLIDAIDIDEESVQQAKENVQQSPWKERVNIHLSSLQKWKPPHSYDLVICNPPFFKDSFLPPVATRRDARHATTLSFEELLSHSKSLLSPEGRLAVILPYAEGNEFMNLAAATQFYICRQLAFFTRKGKPQERWLLELGLAPTETVSSSLTLFEEGDQASPAYQKLTSDFYLKF